MAAWRRGARCHQRQRLLSAASTSASAIDGVPWHQFERLVGEAFQPQGYQVVASGGGGAYGGVDLELSRPARNGAEKTLVQRKHWRVFKVCVDLVRELYGVMAARVAAAGIVITSGQYIADAQTLAQGRNLRLVDGPALVGLIRAATAATPAVRRRAGQ